MTQVCQFDREQENCIYVLYVRSNHIKGNG